MATSQEQVVQPSAPVEEVEQVVSSVETKSPSPVSSLASENSDESEENKSYVRGCNGKSSPPSFNKAAQLITCRRTERHARLTRN